MRVGSGVTKMKCGEEVIDCLIPPHTPVTRLIGAVTTGLGGGGEVLVTRQGSAPQVGAPGVWIFRPLKLPPQEEAGNESCEGFLSD